MRSLIESLIDVGSGFVLAIIIQLTIFPLFDLRPSILDSVWIALIFTVVSITRSWLWRLVFKKYSKRQNLESRETSSKEWIRGYKEWKNNELK